MNSITFSGSWCDRELEGSTHAARHGSRPFGTPFERQMAAEPDGIPVANGLRRNGVASRQMDSARRAHVDDDVEVAGVHLDAWGVRTKPPKGVRIALPGRSNARALQAVVSAAFSPSGA